MKRFSLTLSMFFALMLSITAQQFNKNQGYRLEIGEGLALDCQNGTITFSPVNKKSMTQVLPVVTTAFFSIPLETLPSTTVITEPERLRLSLGTLTKVILINSGSCRLRPTAL